MLDIKKHEIVLKTILGDIFKSDNLNSKLAFKGGTCLYMFHSLQRFSTDLDFNLVGNNFEPQDLTDIAKKYIQLDEVKSKKYTWFWLGSYEKGYQKIKIEISKRKFPDEYEQEDFYGITVPIMKPDFMFAHKLCAITDRNKLHNRDLYDSWFMFSKDWEPEEEIIKIRTKKGKSEYFRFLVDYIEKKVSSDNILDGLGEVLDSKLKKWVKDNLKKELLFQLKIRSK